MSRDSDDDSSSEAERRPFWSVFFGGSHSRRLERQAESSFAAPLTLWLIALALAAVLGLVAIDRAGLTPDWIKERCDARAGLRC